ncbi:hypothetical protein GCM10022221_64530 [Actinocorallia aurea]
MLRLAAQRPVEDIAVADLVRAARVNRTTFYKHAATPAEVLAQALYADLDEVRAGWVRGTVAEPGAPVDVWRRSSEALADHLERHDGVYTVGLMGRRSPVLYRILVDHFLGSARVLLHEDPRLPPAGGDPAEWRTEAYSRFIAHGAAGVVEAWLSLDAPRDENLLVSALVELLARWLITPP